jgi:hypothetical protein
VDHTLKLEVNAILRDDGSYRGETLAISPKKIANYPTLNGTINFCSPRKINKAERLPFLLISTLSYLTLEIFLLLTDRII